MEKIKIERKLIEGQPEDVSDEKKFFEIQHPVVSFTPPKEIVNVRRLRDMIENLNRNIAMANRNITSWQADKEKTENLIKQIVEENNLEV